MKTAGHEALIPLVRHGPRVIKAEAMEIGRQGVDRKDIGASPNEFLLADWNAIFEGAERKMMSWFVNGRIELRMQRRQTGQNLCRSNEWDFANFVENL